MNSKIDSAEKLETDSDADRCFEMSSLGKKHSLSNANFKIYTKKNRFLKKFSRYSFNDITLLPSLPTLPTFFSEF